MRPGSAWSEGNHRVILAPCWEDGLLQNAGAKRTQATYLENRMNHASEAGRRALPEMD
jgi:hypothetical protein